MAKILNPNAPLAISAEVTQKWSASIEKYLGTEAYNALSTSRKNLIATLAEARLAQMCGGNTDGVGVEAYMMPLSQANNINLAPQVANPIIGAQPGAAVKAGTPGSADKAYLLGICVALAAKVIGTEILQTVSVTSQNVEVRFLDVTYDGGKVDNAGNEHMHVVTMQFEGTAPTLTVGGSYVVGKETTPAGEGTNAVWEFMQAKYVRVDRTGGFIFELGASFTAERSGNTLSNIAYINVGSAIGALAAAGKFYALNADMDTLSGEKTVSKVDATTAVENYVPNQTTRGLKRLLNREEADAGTDRSLGLRLYNESYPVRNRVITGDISRLDYKRLEEAGYDPVPYLLSACKNEFAQEINAQIICAARAYGWTNALEALYNGSCFNTFVGPKTVTTKTIAAVQYSDSFLDKDDNQVSMPDMNNLQNTMSHEKIEDIGAFLAMLIQQVAYYIGSDSRFGEGDAVVLSSNYAGFLAACKSFTKLKDKDLDMSASTGAKLSGYINGIKVYVDMQVPANYPVVTVLRSNQNVSVDMPGIAEDTILAPGLAYLVKDLISTTQLVPEKNGGQKLICDSETDVIEVGKRPHSAYLSFIFDCQIPGLSN